jgi:hypothetical protein
MKKNRLIISIAVASVLFVAGCSLSGSDGRSTSADWIDFSKFEPDTTALAGEWTWIRTRCCYGNLDVTTPHSTGETRALVFTEDDTVEVYQNEELQQHTTYAAYLDRAQWGVRTDTLAINWAYIDGPESVYVRAE